ncbi:hypothetical protein B0J18DRAFT_429789 [Chaetomium sp. MPI-SDFR-AT-0129]|nr:hypothetical protein B0J18DRAFT_429789 [Chaetomium sp. MPI-SDFR-AT-0129]
MTAAELEFGGGTFTRISMGVPLPEKPMRSLIPYRVATPIGNHPIVGHFDPEIRNRLHSILSTTDWSHITVCRLGYYGEGPERSPATILIGVRPNTVDLAQASELLRSAADFVYQFSELRDVAIEIIESVVNTSASDSSTAPALDPIWDAPFGYKFNEAFCPQPVIGASIGVSRSTKSGTLGGYLKISTATKSRYVALTCHHVLSDGETAISPLAIRRPAVVCPPNEDMDTWKTTIAEHIEGTLNEPPLPWLRFKRMVDKEIEENENLELSPAPKAERALSKANLEQLNRLERALEDMEKQKTEVTDFLNDFAELYCTSGLRVSSDGWILDWGLAGLLPSRVGSFESLSSALSYDAIIEIRSRQRNVWPLRDKGGISSLDELITGTSPGEKTTHCNKNAVFKCGQSTGKTRGELNGIHSSVQLRYKVQGSSDVTITGKALVVVSPPKLPQRRSSVRPGTWIAFSEVGDSGSLVFDYQGKALGLYFGGQGHTNDYKVTPPVEVSSVDGIYFVAPIVPILDSIQTTVQDDPFFEGLPVGVEILWGKPRPD